MPDEMPTPDSNERIPSIGDRVKRRRNGVTLAGSVFYADRLQVLVKWDDGTSSSLRLGRDCFQIVDTDSSASAALTRRRF